MPAELARFKGVFVAGWEVPFPCLNLAFFECLLSQIWEIFNL